MANSGRNISHSQWLIIAVTVVFALFPSGCKDFMGGKETNLQADKILNDLSKVIEIPDPNVSVPDIYKTPPEIVEQIVGGTPEWKLSYFCMYHTSDELKKIVHEQFATKLFDKKGNETKLVDYTVSSNPATNHLVARCPTRKDAEAVLNLLNLVDVPPIQVKIDCLISEVYADKTLDWETTLLIEELFGEDIWIGPSGLPFAEGITELVQEGATLPAFPGASLREISRSRMGLKIGYWDDKYLALVDLLESKGYLKILMHPTLEIVNGKTATISSTQHVPLQQIYLTNPNQDWYETKTEYIDVVDSLKITPHVFADGYIGLETDILLGSKLTPDGIAQVGIVTMKEIDNEENRIRQGESLVIGGMRKSEQRDVIRGVPFLKDLPLIGVLFSGRDYEERVVETIFILTPTISTGGKPSEEMLEEIRKKHEPPYVDEGLGDIISDPFGQKALEEERQHEVSEAQQSILEADAEKAHARDAIRGAEERAEKAEAELSKVKADAKRIVDKAQKAQAEAEAKTKAAEAAKASADKAKEEADIKAEAAEKAKKEAEKAKEEAEAEKTKPAEQQSNADDKKTKEDVEAKTEETKEDAEKAKAEEDNVVPEA